MPDPLRYTFPVGRLSGANSDVSGAPVMSNLSVGLFGFGGLADDCALSEAANAATSVSAAKDGAIDMVRSGYGRTAAATAISAVLKSSGLKQASKNKAR